MAKKAIRKVEVDGDVYDLPVKNRIATDEEKLILSKFICKIYSSDKYPLKEVCKFADVAMTVFLGWRKKYKEIGDLYTDALIRKKEIYSEGLTELAMSSAQNLLSNEYQVKRTIRYTITGASGETIHKLYEGEKVDLNTVYDVEVTEVIEPNKQNAMITMAVLYNGMKGKIDKTPTPDGNEIEQENKALIDWVGGNNEQSDDVDILQEVETFEQ